ncbi:MAG TPA: glycoside hydrolase family 2 protein, partial [Polyangiaceae bacterium]
YAPATGIIHWILNNAWPSLIWHVYANDWLSSTAEKLNLGASDWFHTPTTTYADYSALGTLAPATLSAALGAVQSDANTTSTQVTLTNSGSTIAFFTRLKLTAGKGGKVVLPVFWQDNYLSLMPNETRTLTVSCATADLGGAAPAVEVSGFNLPTQTLGG